MATRPTELVGEFIDSAEDDQPRALELLQKHPDLIHARWIHGETLVHFMAVEGFYKGVKFLAEHGAGSPPSARRRPQRDFQDERQCSE